MNRLSVASPETYQEASRLLSDDRFSLPVLKAGGMDVVDHLKEGLIEPDLLIDIKRVREGNHDPIAMVKARVTMDANVTLADVAHAELVTSTSPVVSQACENAATPQVRNVATVAGNLLQRPRCWYYRHAQFDCLKKGGHTCYSVEGINKFHAIFGRGPCHIVHPSNLAVAMMVCNGIVHLHGGARDRVDLRDLYHMPDRGVLDEHNLADDEIITHLSFDRAPNSGFYSVKEKQSFDWPLVCAAVNVKLDGSTIAEAHVCAGAVAPVPWPLAKVGEKLVGVAVGDDDAIKAACALSTRGAQPMSENAYKLKLLPVAIRRALLIAVGRGEEVPA